MNRMYVKAFVASPDPIFSWNFNWVVFRLLLTFWAKLLSTGTVYLWNPAPDAIAVSKVFWDAP